MTKKTKTHFKLRIMLPMVFYENRQKTWTLHVHWNYFKKNYKKTLKSQELWNRWFCFKPFSIHHLLLWYVVFEPLRPFLRVCLLVPTPCRLLSQSLSKFNIVLMVTGTLIYRIASRPILPVNHCQNVKLWRSQWRWRVRCRNV